MSKDKLGKLTMVVLHAEVWTYKDEILNSNITNDDIKNREQNFLYITDYITDELYNKWGVEKLYECFTGNKYADLVARHNELAKNEEDEELNEEFDSIWWGLLDFVEEYVSFVINGEEERGV